MACDAGELSVTPTEIDAIEARVRAFRVFRVAAHTDAYRVRPKRYGNPALSA
jgi:hypothetical protein